MLRDAMSGQNPQTPDGDDTALSSFAAIRDWVTQYVAQRIGAAVAADDNFQRAGLDSLGATGMLLALGKRLGRPLSPTLVWEFSSAQALAMHLSEPSRADPGQASAPDTDGDGAEPIAIVGMACRFPQADDLAAFWDLLRQGSDAITHVPKERWDMDALYDPDPSAEGKISSKFGGFLADVESFDPAFFGISPREALQMDPQQRLALELSWEALEDAGIPASALRGGRCGVFVGVIWHDYADLLLRAAVPAEQHTGTGQSLSIVANRISYVLGLQGPSVAIDTACSSSLVAIHLACQSLRSGESSLALVGGVNLMLSPHTSEILSRFGGLSPRGRCRAFDAGADGFVRGEGGGFLVLKPLSAALAAGDSIRCVIRGSAVNNDGASNGLTAPNPAAQREVLAAACKAARVAPREIDYVEAHGTGTKLGDPIEAAALGAVLSAERQISAPLRIGSVKTNVGHLEGAAGIAGVIKTALAIQHRQLPPSLHFVEPNPLIPFADLKLQVVTTLQPWPTERPALAGVSSFGWGGTNCHLILGGLDASSPQLFQLAATDDAGLRQAAQTLSERAQHFDGKLSSLGAGPIPAGEHRLAVRAQSGPDLASKLQAWLAGQTAFGCHAGVVPGTGRSTVFVFSPQGGQWRGMATRLLRESPCFRAVMRACDAAVKRHGHFSLLQELHRPTALSNATSFIQPCLFAVQLGLSAVLAEHGLRPDCVVGHSLGEISAACVAGALSLEDAARVVVHYSRLQATTAGDGGMALVQLSRQEVAALLAADSDEVCIAGENGPQATLLSGRSGALDAIVTQLRERGVFAARVDVNIAAHSAQMDPILDPLRSALVGVRGHSPDVPMWSTSTRTWVQGRELDGAWFAYNLRHPVHFDEAIRTLHQAGSALFVEVNAHPILLPSIQQRLQAEGGHGFACGTLLRGEGELTALLDTIGQMWTHGAVLSDPPRSQSCLAEPAAGVPQLVVLSAASPEALQAQRDRLHVHLASPGAAALPDLAFSLATTRSALRYRIAVIASSSSELDRSLAAVHLDRSTTRPIDPPSSAAKRAFLFAGQGAQTAGMGQSLYRAFPVFRTALDRVLRLFDAHLPDSLRAAMWAPADHPDSARLDQTGTTQPALFALEYALYSLWQSWGIDADYLAGHSIGELVAACIAGVFSLEDAVRLCAARAQLMQALPSGGAMASIAATEESVAAVLASYADRVSIAAVNSPEQVVISGDREHVEQIAAMFAARQVRTKLLRVSHAFHSPRMDPMLRAFAEVAQSIRYHAPLVPLISNLTGRLAGAEICSADYWVQHVRGAVRFAESLRSLGAVGVRTFIEIGPKATLLSLVPAALPAPDITLVASVRAKRDEASAVLEALAELWTSGVAVNWEGVFPWRGQRVSLPSYAFQRQRYWPTQARLQAPSRAADAIDWLYTLDWPECPRQIQTAPQASPGDWLILADRKEGGDALAAALRSQGSTATVVSAALDAPSLRAQLSSLRRRRGVVMLCESTADLTEAALQGPPSSQILRWAEPLLVAIRGLSAGAGSVLWVVTRGAWATEPGVATSPLHASLWGLGRVAAAENPASWGGLIDLDPQGSHSEYDEVARELLTPQAEDQIALRRGLRLAARLTSARVPAPRTQATIVDHATYLITGGTGSIGLCIAEWLVEQGARHLILTSRHGLPASLSEIDTATAPQPQRAVIARLEARGARVTIAAVDVADSAQMTTLLAAADPPLRGVLHAAGVVGDGLLAHQDVQQLSAVLHPKIDGAWALHQASRHMSLDFFVLFSSIAGTLGPVGNGLYAAANAALDSFAAYRRSQGLPTTCIAWGAWATGMATRLLPSQLSALGTRPMPPSTALGLMGQLLCGPSAWCMVAAMDWQRITSALPPGTRQRQLIASFVHEASERSTARAEASQPRPAGAWGKAQLSALVRGCVAQVLALPDASAVSPTQRFGEQGMDSLMAVQLHKALQHKLGVPLSSTVAFDYPTVDRLVSYLLSDVLKVANEQSTATDASAVGGDPIAVVGMAFRLPGDAMDADAAWSVLRDGTDVVREVPPSRFKAADWYDANPETPLRTTVTLGGFLSDIESFDASFFHIAPLEVGTMDPQQRMLLEVSWEALEHAGLNPSTLRETATGVFVGAGANEYAERLQDLSDASAARYAGTGNLPSVLAGRLSYALGLQGPSLFVDTACSSSLVALHLACQSLHAGECEAALVGGVNLLVSPRSFVMMSQLRALSPDGRCRTFAADAAGYGRSEGCVVLVLKRLADVQREGHRILGVIRGTAMNHDGPSSGLTAPNGPAQQAVVRSALQRAGVSATDVDYVECHGTGTALGDPIEVQALASVYGTERDPERPLWLGAVKANLGHLEAASGLAGMVKLLLALQHEQLPAQPALGALNPHIPWDRLPVRVLREPQAWPRGDKLRLAGISSFGISGTNAHAIVQEAPAPVAVPAVAPRSAELVVISAHSGAALTAQAQRLLRRINSSPQPSLVELSYGLCCTRAALEQRAAIVTGSRAELATQLAALSQARLAPGVRSAAQRDGSRPKVVFVFPGQGSQWLGMGRSLLQEEPAFSKAMAACDEAICKEAGFSVVAELLADESVSRMQQVAIVQPVLFAISVALAALWQSWGVIPDAVVGHSLGEIAAAHVAGALSLQDATAIVCRRSSLLRQISGHGEMALLDLSAAETAALLVGIEDRLSIAVCNGPRTTVISGEPAALSQILSQLDARGVFCRRIKVDVASHSPQVDPLLPALRQQLQDLTPQPCVLPMISTVTAQPLSGTELDGEYWAGNLRQPVRFGDVMRSLLDDARCAVLEVSAHPILLPAVEDALQTTSHGGAALASLRRGEPERAALLASLAELWLAGLPVPFARLFPVRPAAIDLPTYAWQRQRYWIDPPEPKSPSQHRVLSVGHPLLGAAQALSTQRGTHLWEQVLDLKRLPWLRDHCVHGAMIFPGAAYLEMALACGRERFASEPYEVLDLALIEALGLTHDSTVVLQAVTTEERPGRLRFQVASHALDAASGSDPSSFRVHARGVLQRRQGAPQEKTLDLDALRQQLGPSSVEDATQIYADMAAMGLEYGEAFRAIRELWCGNQQALGRVELPAVVGKQPGYLLHPALLDGCLQILVAALGADRGSTPWLPVQVSRLQRNDAMPSTLFCHVQLIPPDPHQPNRHRAQLAICDHRGRVLAELSELTVQRRPGGEPLAPSDRWFLSTDWQPKPVPAAKVSGGRWLLLGDGGALGRTLRDCLQAAGHAVVQGESLLPNSTALRVLLTASFGDRAPTAIVHMGRVGVEGVTESNIPEKALLQGCDSVLHVVQALLGMWFREVPRLWLFTRGAQAAGDGLLSLTQAPLLGLARTIALEHPELRCLRLDLDPARPDTEAQAILAELLADDDEDEVALRGGERLVARLVHRLPEAEGHLRHERAAGQPFRLNIDKPGVLDHLFLERAVRRPPGPGEIEIAVEAAGLNFMDVMNAMGIRPGANGTPLQLGNECTGRIVAVGEGVIGLEPGQAVVAATPGSFATHVTVAACKVVPRPAQLSAVQAAALPIAYMTAWYGLAHLARLTRGERVLIHSAAGGTGLAAVFVARHLGAEVLATAGSEQKREWLRALGIRHVMDSRSLDFAAQILAVTGGQGVDVVLNSLSGPAIEASFSALGQDGRFIELGKTDIYSDRPLGLSPFKKSLSYSAVDLAALSQHRQDRFARLLSEVMPLIAASVLPPLPVEAVPIARAADAFRKMAQAQHTGKLVLTVDSHDVRVRAPQKRDNAIRSDASYLVTGGLGGLGLKVAEWLGSCGAGHLVLMGRAGDVSFEQRAAVSALVAKGTRVSIAKGDVASRLQLEHILADIHGSGMPLRGIIHAAGSLDDGLIMQQTPLRFRTVMGPKVQGAWHLHELTRSLPLDFFVLYSSAAGLLGSAGQANYAAANTFLDALAHHRRAQGLPALSINWGAFSEVGLASEQENRGARLATRGIDSLTPEQGIEALSRLLKSGAVQMSVVPLDIQRWGEFYRAAASSRLLSRLHGEAPKESRSEQGAREIRVRLATVEPAARATLLAEVLLTQVAQVLRLSENQIAMSVPLSSLGMDSLMGLELRNRIESVLGVRVPASLLWTHPTVGVLSEYLLRELVPDGRTVPRPKERSKITQAPAAPAGPGPGTSAASVVPVVSRASALIRLHTAPTPKLHLICFPPGGGGPELFQRWATKLPQLVSISGLHLPGRGARLTEPPYVDMRQLLQGIREELASALATGIPVAFVGHSFGSVLAFEAAAELVAAGREWPVHLFVSACASPRRGSALEHYLGFGKQDVGGTFSSDTLSDAELLGILRRAGALGRGADKLDDDELAAFFIPTLRADLRVLRTYTHEQRRVLPIPITAIIGRQDPMIDANHITEWMGHTSASFSARIICADHGIRYEHMWSIISSQLAALLDVPSGG